VRRIGVAQRCEKSITPSLKRRVEQIVREAASVYFGVQ
jgi:hypothetical protein